MSEIPKKIDEYPENVGVSSQGIFETCKKIGLRLGRLLVGATALFAPTVEPHQCGGCPMCLPPPVRKNLKEEEEEDGEAEGKE